MVNLTIDGQEIEVPSGITLLQACELAGKEIPRFCYHERLAVAGNCRMCLVEVEKSPKPVASCAWPIAEGMVVKTDSPMVKGARHGVMEFLLINHPLDCPICDQGGECDLQDQAMAYGKGMSRFEEYKRAVMEKDFGPLVKTYMTRCIHCTRCIRFLDDVAGVEELGATGRGEAMEIGTYVQRGLSSELSGNIIDLCPVGALTSKPYAFTSRPWELNRTESIDVLDAVGSSIRIDSRGAEVMRVLPRLNDDVNEEWLGDKSRFAVDGLKRQRLDVPMVRSDGRLQPCDWDVAFRAIADRVGGEQGAKIAGIAGDLADAESIHALRELLDALGSPHRDGRQDGAKLDPACRAGYLFNTGIAGIDRADACLLIGTNPRVEAPIINARLRGRWLAGGFKVGVVGAMPSPTFRVESLGAGPRTLTEIAEGRHPFAAALRDAKAPMLILGQGALVRSDGAAVLATARAIAEANGLVKEGWNGFNVLHTAAGRVGALDVGFVPGPGGRDTAGIIAGAERGEIKVLFLLGADEIDTSRLGACFVIYIGHHGDRGAHRADVILPAAAYTEKSATWVNTEGRVQRTVRAVFPPGQAREDWAILRALSAALGRALPFDSITALRSRMERVAPALARTGEIAPAPWGAFGTTGPMEDRPFASAVANYYMTDPVSRASATMARCTAELLPRPEATGIHG
ncbi:MAG: NADH-quinone oxidoreductase subunit G [Alphaproteobacteria bacterium]|nr:NADH-quinone oxidoreductase subunit G [Alphaproteobacteria bacterium]